MTGDLNEVSIRVTVCCFKCDTPMKLDTDVENGTAYYTCPECSTQVTVDFSVAN